MYPQQLGWQLCSLLSKIEGEGERSAPCHVKPDVTHKTQNTTQLCPAPHSGEKQLLLLLMLSKYNQAAHSALLRYLSKRTVVKLQCTCASEKRRPQGQISQKRSRRKNFLVLADSCYIKIRHVNMTTWFSESPLYNPLIS